MMSAGIGFTAAAGGTGEVSADNGRRSERCRVPRGGAGYKVTCRVYITETSARSVSGGVQASFSKHDKLVKFWLCALLLGGTCYIM